MAVEKLDAGRRYDRHYQHDAGWMYRADGLRRWEVRRNVWIPRAIMLVVEAQELGIDPEQARRIAHDTDFVLSQMVDGVPPNTI